MKNVLIFGGSGQIGLFLCRRLSKDFTLTVVTRNAHQKAYRLKTLANAGYLSIVQASIFDEDKLRNLIKKAQIVINLVGLLNESGKGNSFENIHTNFPNLISKLCNEYKIEQFIHISALGIEKATDSKYAQSKIKGEKIIRENFSRATIIKPSLIFSVSDSLTTRFMTLLSFLPIFPLYYEGKTKFAPIHASDVAELIFYLISNEITSRKIEAIGPQVLSFKEIIQILLKCINKKRILLPMPLFIARLSAFFFQLFPNPLLTLDQLRLLKYSNTKSETGKTNFDIGCPSKLFFEESVKKYSFNWRDGGQFSVIENNKK
jgi:NADH dehydrogenase